MLAQLAFARALESANNKTTKTIRLVARIEVFLAERCLKSYCSVVLLFFSTRWGTFPQVCRRAWRCCSTSDDFSGRVVSTWTLLLDADHQRDDSGSSVKLQRKRPGRLVRTRLLDADTPTQQFIALLVVVRRRSQIMPTHAGSTWFVVNIRLTARLQSLPLARCWPACFALFSSFPLAFASNTNSFKLIVRMFWTLSGY